MQRNDKIAQVIFLPLVQIEKLQQVDKQMSLKQVIETTKILIHQTDNI